MFKKDKSLATVFLEPAEKAFKAIKRAQKAVDNDIKKLEFTKNIVIEDKHKYETVQFMDALDLERGRWVNHMLNQSYQAINCLNITYNILEKSTKRR